LPELAEHASAKERVIAQVEHRADDICLAWLLEEVLHERGWETTFQGEITGVIGSGLFARFGEVFEGYIPVRKLPGYFELDALGTALVARRGGRRYRIGDRLEVRVTDIDRPAGKIEIALP
jgi:ribonuclease R